jgi:hypothetical protein
MDVSQAHYVASIVFEACTRFLPSLAHVFRLNKRLERLLRILLQNRFDEDPAFRLLTQERQDEFRYLALPGALANNPFVTPRQLAAWEAKQRTRKSGRRPSGHGQVAVRRRLAVPSVLAKPASHSARRREFNEAVRRGILLFERAFPFPEEKDRRLVSRTAEALGRRLWAVHERARWERTELQRLLKQAALSPPRTRGEVRGLALEVLGLFSADHAVWEGIIQLNDQTSDRLEKILHRRYGPVPATKFLLPKPSL